MYEVKSVLSRAEYEITLKRLKYRLRVLRGFIGKEILIARERKFVIESVMEIVNVIHWSAFNRQNKSRGIALIRSFKYLEDDFPDIVEAAPTLISIRCKYAHSNYTDTNNLHTKVGVYLPLIVQLYENIDILIDKDSDEIITEMIKRI